MFCRRRYILLSVATLLLVSAPSAPLPLSAAAAWADWELPFTGDVPRMDIVTADGAPVTSRTDYVAAQLTLHGAGTLPNVTDSVLIRGRGNTSWRAYPKKSYRLKFAHKQQLFGTVENRHYVLVANYIDPTLTVNAAALKAARMAGSAFAGHAVPVELNLNGEYLGSYLLTEKIRVGQGSVDIDRESGVLLELDVNFDEPQRFISSHYYLPVMVHYPEDQAQASLTATIAQRWNTFEEAVRDGGDLTAHVDTAALVRYLFIYDLFCNNEVAHPKSIYCSYAAPSGLLTFGPVWDFDWSCGYLGERYFDLPFLEPFEQGQWFAVISVADYVGGASAYNGYPFFDNLMHHPQVLPAYARFCYNTLSQGFLERLLTYIDDYAAFLSPSAEHDAERWHQESTSQRVHESKSPQVEPLKEWLSLRADELLTRSHDILVTTAMAENPQTTQSSQTIFVTSRIYIRNGKKYLIK